MEVWQLTVPLVAAVIAWILNELSKRRSDRFRRREENYRALLLAARGFYLSAQDQTLKNDFLDQVRLAWLYAPTKVVRAANDFLDSLLASISSELRLRQQGSPEGSGPSRPTKEQALGTLVATMRDDLGWNRLRKKHRLAAEEFRHAVSA